MTDIMVLEHSARFSGMTLTKGVIDETAEEVFTCGWCWAWAFILAESCDGEFVLCCDFPSDDEGAWDHAFCRTDRILYDVLGKQPESNVYSRGGDLKIVDIWDEKVLHQLAYECDDETEKQRAEALIATKWVMGI